MWIVFMAVGVLGAGLAWIIQRGQTRLWKLALAVVIVLVVSAVGFYMVAGPVTLGEEYWWNSSPWRETLLYVCMLMGMAMRYITKAIEDRRQKLSKWQKAGSIGEKPPLAFDKWEFAYPLLISALTFGALLSQLKGDSLAFESALLSFQTGFFWQTLLKRN